MLWLKYVLQKDTFVSLYSFPFRTFHFPIVQYTVLQHQERNQLQIV